MKHLKEKWHVIVVEHGKSYIKSYGGWCICDGVGCLPSDDDGSKTLQYICDLHNATLK